MLKEVSEESLNLQIILTIQTTLNICTKVLCKVQGKVYLLQLEELRLAVLLLLPSEISLKLKKLLWMLTKLTKKKLMKINLLVITKVISVMTLLQGLKRMENSKNQKWFSKIHKNLKWKKETIIHPKEILNKM